MPNTTLVILMIPVAFFMMLRSPIMRFRGKQVGPLDWPSIVQGSWALAFCIVEGGIPGRLGLSQAELFLVFVVGLAVLSVPTMLRARGNG